MADEFEIKRHDRRPFFVVNLTDEDGVVDLTTAGTALFNMKGGPSGGTAINRGTASITNPSTGEVTFQWGTADTSISGTYSTEVPIIWNDGRQETYPGGPSTGTYWTVLITDDIDNV